MQTNGWQGESKVSFWWSSRDMFVGGIVRLCKGVFYVSDRIGVYMEWRI